MLFRKRFGQGSYDVDENNLIELRTDPILIRYAGKNILIDSGIGKGKLDDKMKRNLGVTCRNESRGKLAELGLTT